MLKISSKIMMTIVACSVCTLILIGGFSLYQGTSYIKSETVDKLNYMSTSYANKFNQTLLETETYVDSLRSTIYATFQIDEFRVNPNTYLTEYLYELDAIIGHFASNQNNAIGIFVTFDPYLTSKAYEVWYQDTVGNGQMLRISAEVIKETSEDYAESWEGYPNTWMFMNRQDPDFEYLYKTMDAKLPIWFDPAEDSGLSVTVVSYVVPIIIDGTVLGVVGMDTAFDDIKKAIEEMFIYDSGYAVLFNKEYGILADSHRTMKSNHISEKDLIVLLKEDMKSHEGIVEYKYDGRDEILSYCKLSNGWILCLLPPANEIYSPIFSLSKWMIVLTALGILISVTISYLFSRRMAKRMDKASEQLRYIEIGDFTQEIPKELLSSDDDLGHFIKSVHTMQSIIRELVQQLEASEIKGNKNNVLLDDSLEKNQTAVSELIQAIEQIFAVRTEKEENLRETLKKIEDINAKLKVTVAEEVQNNRQRDAVLIYQSRQAKLGEMIGNIAHQWKQPLNSLLLILSDLKDAYDYGELDANYCEKALSKSQKIVVQMLQMMEDFRQFLSPMREKEIFSVRDQILIACDLVEEGLRSGKIEITVLGEKDVFVYGYAGEFSQAILNVIDNAKDALLDLPSHVRQIEIMIERCNANVEVRIFNNGSAISDDIMEKIFLPFFTTKSLGKGTGIGLYMAKKIIEEHTGGSIKYVNHVRGVACLITLPICSMEKI